MLERSLIKYDKKRSRLQLITVYIPGTAAKLGRSSIYAPGIQRPVLRLNASLRGAALTELQQRPRPKKSGCVTQLKILVVVDESSIRKLLRMGLKPRGYELLEASDGKTSFRLLPKDPDLVILDLQLAGIDGLELLRKMRRRDETVPIVVLSNPSERAGTAKALDLGANDFITKPFCVEELLTRIQVAMRHWSHGGDERMIFQTGDLSVDMVRRVVEVAGREIRLPVCAEN